MDRTTLSPTEWPYLQRPLEIRCLNDFGWTLDIVYINKVECLLHGSLLSRLFIEANILHSFILKSLTANMLNSLLLLKSLIVNHESKRSRSSMGLVLASDLQNSPSFYDSITFEAYLRPLPYFYDSNALEAYLRTEDKILLYWIDLERMSTLHLMLCKSIY